MTGRRDAVLQALDRALITLEQAKRERWRSFSGKSLEPQLTALGRTLHGMRDQEAEGEPLREQEVIDNLLRFVGDWIPDPGHPLLGDLGSILDAIRGQTSTRSG